MDDPNPTLGRLCSAVRWAEESTVARKVNFDARVLDAIADSVLEARGAFTPGQAHTVDNIFTNFNIGGWEASRARKARKRPVGEEPDAKRSCV